MHLSALAAEMHMSALQSALQLYIGVPYGLWTSSKCIY